MGESNSSPVICSSCKKEDSRYLSPLKVYTAMVESAVRNTKKPSWCMRSRVMASLSTLMVLCMRNK